MTSHSRKPRQPSAPNGATVREIFSRGPARQGSGPPDKPRRTPLSPPPPAWALGEATLDVRTSIMLVPLWYHLLLKCQPYISIFSPKNEAVCRRPRSFCTRLGIYWAASSAAGRSQLVMTPLSSSKVVVLTMWVLPTRISWVPSSLVRLSFTVASMVKTRS